MTQITLDGAAVVRGAIYQPAEGVWVADLDVDTETAPAGRVALVDDTTGVTLSGTVVSGDVVHGLWSGRVVGGAGGLRGVLPTRAYRSALLADVLADALSEAGETLAAGSAALDTTVALWHRTTGPAIDTVRTVASTAGLAWRVTAAGEVWIGADTWPDAPDVDLSMLARDPRQGFYTLGGDVLALRPGTVVAVRDEAGDTFVRAQAIRVEIDATHLTAVVFS